MANINEYRYCYGQKPIKIETHSLQLSILFARDVEIEQPHTHALTDNRQFLCLASSFARQLPEVARGILLILYLYCCVPARWGFQQTHPGLRGSDKTRGQGSFGPFTGGLDQAFATNGLIHVKHLT